MKRTSEVLSEGEFFEAEDQGVQTSFDDFHLTTFDIDSNPKRLTSQNRCSTQNMSPNGNSRMLKENRKEILN